MSLNNPYFTAPIPQDDANSNPLSDLIGIVMAGIGMVNQPGGAPMGLPMAGDLWVSAPNDEQK
jgi:hypothetical protein